MSRTVTLCKPQCGSSEESIIQQEGNRCDDKMMEQTVTPVDSPAARHCQKVENNPTVEQAEEINKTDLRRSWGKAVSFITNTSNKLCLSSTLLSLAQILVVAKGDRIEENSSVKENDLNNTILFYFRDKIKLHLLPLKVQQEVKYTERWYEIFLP